MSEATVAASAIRAFLIADIRGFTGFTAEHGDEAAARLAGKLADTAEEVAASRDGAVLELRGDEVLAVFSSARGALWAAVDLLTRWERARRESVEATIPIGIGLDSGEAVPIKGGYRGAALNRAARLCALAGPGEVLASEGILHLAGKVDGLLYTSRGAIQLKGFADPVQVFEILPSETEHTVADGGSTDQSLPTGGFLGALPAGRLVGRNQEMTNVLAAVDATTGGAGRLVLLAGEPGVGKTRLAQEATVALYERGFLIAAGRCYEPQSAVPHYPFLEALARVFSTAPVTIRADAPKRWPYLGRILPDLITTHPVPSQSGDDQPRLFRSVAGFLEKVAAERPLAILLDDLHWADGSSLDLLHHLARELRDRPVFLLGTYRDVEVGRQHPLEAVLRDLGREGLVERIDVRRLEEDGTRALIAAAMNEPDISDEFGDLIFRRTEGNPFFVQQVLRVLVERGDVFRREGIWDRKRIEEIEVPESIRSVIGQRLLRLSNPAQEVLHEASVLGQSFEFEPLLAMSGRLEREVEDALEEATAAGLVHEAGRDGYSFDHALTQQSLYGELSSRRLRRLHLAAGEALEARLGRTRRAEDSVRAAELAWHFLAGDDAKRALRWSLAAGDAAEKMFAHFEAEGQYRAALELARESGDQQGEARATERLGAVLSVQSRYDEALRSLEEAAALYQRIGDVEAERLTIALIGRVHADRGTPEDGVARLQGAAQAPDTPASRGEAALQVALSRLYFASGRYADQLTTAALAADIARAAGDDRILVEAEIRRASAHAMLGEGNKAIAVGETTLPIAETVGDPESLGMLYNNLAYSYFTQGEFRRNREYRARARTQAERSGDPIRISFATASLAQALYHLGEWDEALVLALRAREIAAPIGPVARVPYILFALAHIYINMREWERAAPLVDEGVAIAERVADLQALSWAALLLADLVGHGKEAADVIPRLEEILRRCREEGSHESWPLCALARATLTHGDPGRALELAREGLRVATEIGEYPMRTDALLLIGMAAARRGQWDKAEEAFAETIDLAVRAPYPSAEAHASLEWGKLLGKKQALPAAREKLTRARDIFSRLGAPYYTEQASACLAALE